MIRACYSEKYTKKCLYMYVNFMYKAIDKRDKIV